MQNQNNNAIEQKTQSSIDDSLKVVNQNTLVIHAVRILVKSGIIAGLFLSANQHAFTLSIYTVVSELLDQASIYIRDKNPKFKYYVEIFYVLNSVLLISVIALVGRWILNDFYLIYLVHISSAMLVYGTSIGSLSILLSTEAYFFLLYVSHAPLIYFLRIPIIGVIVLRLFIAQSRIEKINSLLNTVVNIEKAKQDFIAIASHNLRTPVAAIYGYIEILVRGDAGQLQDEQKTYVERIKENNQKLEQLTEQLLQISILDVGKETNILKQPTQIEVVLEDVYEEFTPLAEEKKLELKYLQPEGLLPLVTIDVEKIKGVLTNIVDNAIKYTEKGSVTISAAKQENSITISVKDTGVGISKEDLPKMFTKFFRSGNILVYNKIGIGLGLYLGKQIVEKHGGKITVASEENKGTTFTVELPIVKEGIL